MTRWITATASLLVALLAAGRGGAAEDRGPATRPGPEFEPASYLADWPRWLSPPDPRAAEAAVAEPARIGRALELARRVVPAEPGAWLPDVADMRARTRLRATTQPVGLQIEVDARGVGADPRNVQYVRAYASALADQYGQALAEQIPAAHARAMADLEQRLAAARRESEEAGERARRLLDRLRGFEGIEGPTEEGVRGPLRRLEQERQKLALERVARQARREALEETIALVAKRSEMKAAEDPVAREFERVADARAREVAALRQLVERKQAAEAEIDRAEAALAEARAKVVERREAAARAAGGDVLSDLNRELLMLGIDAAELRARLEHVEKGLAALRDAVGVYDELARAQERARKATDRVGVLLAELQQLEARGGVAERPVEVQQVLRLRAEGR